jgi:hypothetical protein
MKNSGGSGREESLARVLRRSRMARGLGRARAAPCGATAAAAPPEPGDAIDGTLAHRRQTYQGQYRDDQQKIQKDTK